MYYYVKANPKAAQASGQAPYRFQLKDGNYLLREDDIIQLGYSLGFGARDIEKTLAAVGGLRLTPPQAAEEQNGIVCRQLPDATDPQFYVEPAVPDVPSEDESDVNADGESSDTDVVADDVPQDGVNNGLNDENDVVNVVPSESDTVPENPKSEEEGGAA